MNMLKEILDWLNPKVIRSTVPDKLVRKIPQVIKPTHEIYRDKKNQWRWRITASNGNIIAASCEGYKNKVDAEKNLRYITSLRIGM
jgi:uncharacterized protein YegP (UPF0339 family)